MYFDEDHYTELFLLQNLCKFHDIVAEMKKSCCENVAVFFKNYAGTVFA
jgi:hypothetical protein